MSRQRDRAQALTDLVEFRSPLRNLVDRVSRFPWDCGEDLVCVRMLNVVAVLRRYFAGELTPSDVEAWADAVEMREDLSYDAGVVDVLYRLSTPDINGAITRQLAKDLIEKYDAAV